VTKSSWWPYAILVIGLLAVSSASPFIRVAQNEGVSSFVISAWRLTLASLILTPLVLTRYRADLKKLTRRQVGLAILSGLFLSVHFASWVTSLEYTSVLTSVVLVNTHPIWIALAAPFVLGEKISRRTGFGILVATIGGIVITLGGGAGTAPKQDAPLLGAILAVIGAITVAGYFMIGRRLRASMSSMPYIWMTYGTAAIIMCGLVLITREPVAGFSGSAYLAMIFMALFPQLIGHSSYNYALGYLSAAYVSLTILGEPIGSTILAALARPCCSCSAVC
jgi:drug/metabolite transporter (DMT)-like permease